MCSRWCVRILLILFNILEIVVFQQLIVFFLSDVISLETGQKVAHKLKDGSNGGENTSEAGSPGGGGGVSGLDVFALAGVRVPGRVALTSYLLTFFSAANICISTLNLFGAICSNPRQPSCGGVVFFRCLSKCWTIWKVVFAVAVCVLVYSKGVPVPVVGTNTFSILLLVFAGYECLFLWTQGLLLERLYALHEDEKISKDDILYQPIHLEDLER